MALVVALLAGCSRQAPSPASVFPSGDLVDLSHAYDKDTIFWPTADPFRLETVADGVTPGGYYYAANNLFTSEHGGTHIDAPVHFAQGAQPVDQILLDRLFAPLVIVDVVSQSEANPDYQVTMDDLARAERERTSRTASCSSATSPRSRTSRRSNACRRAAAIVPRS